MTMTFHLPTKIIFGVGCIKQLGMEAGNLGKKAIMVTGQTSLRRSGLLDKVVQDLNSNRVEVIVFDRVVPNPRSSTIDEGAKLVREQGIDLLIGMGGGSAIDSAKGIRLASTGTRPIWGYISASEIQLSQPLPPLILVPTMAATGSEANHFASITNWEKREKRGLASPHLFPTLSIVDPELTLSVPPQQTAQGGVDIFCHAVESYITASESSLITDGITETVMRVVVMNLPKVLKRPDDIIARAELSWASTIACSQLLYLGGGYGQRTCHSISNYFSGYYDIAHGDSLAAVLPAWMRYTLPVRQEKLRSLGRNVFGGEDGIAATEKWLKQVGMRKRLRDFGVEPEHFEEFAASCMRTDARTKAHPRPLDVYAIKKIYEESY